MLRACTRLTPRLAPRAEAALGTRSMAMSGLKGAARPSGCSGGAFPWLSLTSVLGLCCAGYDDKEAAEEVRWVAGVQGTRPVHNAQPTPPASCTASCCRHSLHRRRSKTLAPTLSLQMLFFKKVPLEGGATLALYMQQGYPARRCDGSAASCLFVLVSLRLLHSTHCTSQSNLFFS